MPCSNKIKLYAAVVIYTPGWDNGHQLDPRSTHNIQHAAAITSWSSRESQKKFFKWPFDNQLLESHHENWPQCSQHILKEWGGNMIDYTISEGLAVYWGISTFEISHSWRFVAIFLVLSILGLFGYMERRMQNFRYNRTKMGVEWRFFKMRYLTLNWV